MLRPDPKLLGPERDCIRLRSVGYRQHKLSQPFTQGAARGCADLKWFDGRQDHDADQDQSRYLIGNTKEFLGPLIAVIGEIARPMAK